MGFRKEKENKLTEELIQQCLCRDFLSSSTKKYEIFNLFVFDWESDYIAITKSDYVYEVEIKTTRTDFFNDFKNKGKKHLLLKEKYSSESEFNKKYPNYFYYAVPKGLITVEEIPEYAGLIYITEHNECEIIKQAPKLLKEPTDIDNLELVDKFYYGYKNWRDKYHNNSINALKSYIKLLEKDIKNYDNLLSEANCEIDFLKIENNKLKN